MASGAARGVIVEFDFAVMNGAELLFGVAQRYLRELDGIGLDLPVEARYLTGRSYEEGLARYFRVVKTKKTAQKAARELAAAFAAAVSAGAQKAITAGFRNFVTALAEKDVKVVIATRASPESAAAAFGSMLVENVSLYREASLIYGCPSWDSWRRACAANGVSRATTFAVTGSGPGVKSALLAGMGSMAVVKDRVAFQDYTGAAITSGELSVTAAKRLLALMRQ